MKTREPSASKVPSFSFPCPARRSATALPVLTGGCLAMRARGTTGAARGSAPPAPPKGRESPLGIPVVQNARCCRSRNRLPPRARRQPRSPVCGYGPGTAHPYAFPRARRLRPSAASLAVVVGFASRLRIAPPCRRFARPGSAPPPSLPSQLPRKHTGSHSRFARARAAKTFSLRLRLREKLKPCGFRFHPLRVLRSHAARMPRGAGKGRLDRTGG